MYSIIVEAGFSAIHRVRLGDGRWEPPHGHDWRVRACFSAAKLDERGMVVDFCEAQATLRATVDRLHHTDLNTIPQFAETGATAECVARYLFDRLRETGLSGLRRVEVVEAPGCAASFEADSAS